MRKPPYITSGERVTGPKVERGVLRGLESEPVHIVHVEFDNIDDAKEFANQLEHKPKPVSNNTAELRNHREFERAVENGINAIVWFKNGLRFAERYYGINEEQE